jgi:SAM-dependent methyltransferase
MSIVGRQFGRPHGLLGRLVGRAMARGNAHLNEWVIQQVRERCGDEVRRIVEQVRSGRLTLLRGEVESLQALAPVDLIVAVHVLYFWDRPAVELPRLHGALRPGGLLALGYQLRSNMPGVSQKGFPREGHLLYDSEEEVFALLRAAGFTNVSGAVKGSIEAPEGRLALAPA